jgi:AraC-like DNA-binding protein
MHYNLFHFFRYEYTGNSYTDARAGSPLYYLAMMCRGSCRIVSEERTICAGEGDVFFIPRGLPYQSYWFGPEVSFLSLGFLSLAVHPEMHAALQVIPTSPSEREELLRIPIEGQNVSCAALSAFYGVMAKLLPRMQTDSPDPKRNTVAQAKDYISRHTASSIPEVARYCGVSEPYLYNAFRATEGITPNEFRRRMLCQRAVVLLTTTDRSVESISDQLGFSSTSWFRKVIKKHTGCSPRQIRRTGKM